MQGSVVEDASWLHPVNNVQHVNLTELNTVLKGVNLVLQWQANVLHIRTDSACVYQWTLDALTGKVQLTTKAASKMLLQRQLRTLVDLIKKYGLVDVTRVKSVDNKTDQLTRVPLWWLSRVETKVEPTQQTYAASAHWQNIQQIAHICQQSGHPGIKCMYFAKRKDAMVSKANMWLAVKTFMPWHSIDLVPVPWRKETWCGEQLGPIRSIHHSLR